MSFEGFSPETVDFLWGLRLNNNREWYHAHKEECRKYLTSPMNELANAVYEGFGQARPDIPFTTHVSRIYRDARRLYGKGPFKDHLWFSLFDARYGDWTGRPTFWFQIGADGWSYGMGTYDGTGKMMERIRARIAAAPAEMLELQKRLDGQDEFVLGGEEYKKKYRDCPVPELSGWYARKYIDIIHSEPAGPSMTGPELADRVLEGMLWLMPFYDYFFPLMAADEQEDAGNV